MRLIDADALMKAMYERAFETDGDTMWQSGCWVRYRAVEQVIKECPTIEPEPQWIPCSEAVPATEDKVLCQTITKKGVVNFVIGYHTENFGWACGMNSNVQAWMPLPEPYKED